MLIFSAMFGTDWEHLGLFVLLDKYSEAEVAGVAHL